jgi:hypothetical protein
MKGTQTQKSGEKNNARYFSLWWMLNTKIKKMYTLHLVSSIILKTHKTYGKCVLNIKYISFFSTTFV